MPLPGELPHVHHAGPRHVGGAGVADVRVVLPDYGAGLGSMEAHETVQGVDHVPVSHVPRSLAALDHGPVIALGVSDHERVLLGGKMRLGVSHTIRWRAL